MRVDDYALEALWSSALRDLPSRKASFFVTSLVAPGVLWLLGAALAGLSTPVSMVGLAGLVFLGVLAVSSSLLQVQWKSRTASARLSTRVVISTHQAYYSLMILFLSFYCLVFALQIALRVEIFFYNSILLIYVLSAVAGALWAPRSLPKAPEDDALAARREVRWLPWVFGAQGALVSLGVFLGVWLSRDGAAWMYFLGMGLAALSATLMVTLGLITIYRFAILALRPIPSDALKDSASVS